VPARSLLKDPFYRRYWIALFISQFGTWMQATALGWLALKVTGRGSGVGAVLALLFLPSLFLSLPAGALADRFPRARLLFFYQLGMALASAGLFYLVASGQATFLALKVFALIYGSFSALEVPTRQAFNVELAGRKRLAGAIALGSFSFNVARVLAPGVAGLLIARAGLAVAFLLNALSFLPMLLFLLRVPAKAPARSAKGAWAALLEGFGYVRRTALVRWVLLMLFLVGTFGINFQAFVPAHARLVLGLDAEGYGFLLSALGLGSLFGASISALATRVHPWWVPRGALLLAAALAGSAFFRTPASAAGLFVVAGAAMVLTLISANATVQALVPEALRGRVMALYSLVLMGSGPPGMYLTGLAFDLFGGLAPLVLGGLTALPALYFFFKPWPRTLTPVAG